MKILGWLFRHTIASVPFGIATMVLIAIYIALGSGFPSLREYFEMDELMFFSAWPLKVMMALLVVNLAVVTIRRIPLTPPRYGVWCIHIGIITLVLSTSVYYSQKVEGLTIIPMNGVTQHFYDRWERSLYVRAEFRRSEPAVLSTLPRFGTYEPGKSDRRLKRSKELKDVQFVVRDVDRATGERVMRPLHEVIGLPHPVTFDVVGYWPYASIQKTWRENVEGGSVGIMVQFADVAKPEVNRSENDGHGGAGGVRERAETGPDRAESGSVRVGDASADGVRSDGVEYLVAGDADSERGARGLVEIEHRHLPTQADVDLLIGSASRLHELTLKIGGADGGAAAKGEAIKRFVEPGERFEIGEYVIVVEGFVPQFPMSGTGEPVDVLSLLVERKEGEPKQYRRMVLNGQSTQTDFRLDVVGAGPMGQRQTTPLDPDLNIEYRFNDPMRLMPGQETTARHLLLTSEESDVVRSLVTDIRRPHRTERHESGRGELSTDASLPLLGGIDAPPVRRIAFERRTGLARFEQLFIVPEVFRDKDEAAAGLHQVVQLRVNSGEFTRDVYVPYSLWAFDGLFQSATINIPGATMPVEIALGNTRRDLPLRVKLDRFEALPYAGAPVAATSLMRDFRSHITVTDLMRPWTKQDTVKLNAPVYVRRPVNPAVPLVTESWIFYQAQWDPGGQRWTVLGVANRPAVRVMAFACVLITIGLCYAFYVKPVLIERMKRRALEAAQKKSVGVGRQEAAGVT